MSAVQRIASLTLNPAIDQTVVAPGFSLDSVNRATSTQSDAGGKGINVASFLARFGHPVVGLGLLGEDNEAMFTQHFQRVGIEDAFTRIKGATRTNIKIIDPPTNRITDLNFPGAQTSAHDLEAVERALMVAAIDGLDWLILSGSLPLGLSDDSYLRFIKWARMTGCKTVVDTSGGPLKEAIAAKPDVIKPNVQELREYLLAPLASPEDVADAARTLVEDGISMVVVSMGHQGAVFCTKEGAYHALAEAPKIVTTVGAGDAMVAGVVHGHVEGKSLEEMSRTAIAFSIGALGEIGPRIPEPAQIAELETLVRLSPI